MAETTFPSLAECPPEDLLDMYQRMPTQDIAAHFNVTRQAVHARLKKTPGYVPISNRKGSRRTLPTAAEMLAERLSIAQLAIKYDVSVPTIKEIIDPDSEEYRKILGDIHERSAYMREGKKRAAAKKAA